MKKCLIIFSLINVLCYCIFAPSNSLGSNADQSKKLVKSLEEQYLYFKIQSKLLEKNGNDELALKYLKICTRLKDSISKIETNENLVKINSKYETVKKEQENALLHKNNEIESLAISRKDTILKISAGIFVIVLSFLVIIIILFRLKSRAYKKIMNQNLQILQFEEEEIEEQEEYISLESSKKVKSDIRFEDLGLLLEKFLSEDKPFLWPELTLDEFCKILKTNRTYLSKVINKKYNQTFFDLIGDLRINSAKEMLRDPSFMYMSVEGIGTLSGFKSNSNFHRNFKKIVGLTPSEFRDMALAEAVLPEKGDKQRESD